MQRKRVDLFKPRLVEPLANHSANPSHISVVLNRSPPSPSLTEFPRRQEKRAGRNFPMRFDVPFIGAIESIGLIQRIPLSCPRMRGEKGGGGTDRKRSGRRYRRTGAQARCQQIPNFTPSRPAILVLALPPPPPPANRTSGQSEITLSPSRCVQSKLQFKSSCQTLFSRSLSFPQPPPPLSLPISLRAAGIRNTENSSSSTAD